jgi:hypothetical protein
LGSRHSGCVFVFGVENSSFTRDGDGLTCGAWWRLNTTWGPREMCIVRVKVSRIGEAGRIMERLIRRDCVACADLIGWMSADKGAWRAHTTAQALLGRYRRLKQTLFRRA